jgi:hypothetical protein
VEYITFQITPSPVRGWVASQYVKATMPAVVGHPRTLRTFPEQILTGLSGLDVGSAAGVLSLHIGSVGTLPFCARCEADLGFGAQ